MGKVIPLPSSISDVPTSVRVGPFKYAVLCDEASRLRAQERNENESKLHGYTNTDTLEIMVSEVAPRELQQETLLHEVLHAVCHMTGLAAEWGEDYEEQVISVLSPVLFDVLKRNVELVDFLTLVDDDDE